VIPTLMVLSFVVPLAEEAEHRHRTQWQQIERDNWIALGVLEADEQWYFHPEALDYLEDHIDLMKSRWDRMSPTCPPPEARFTLPPAEDCRRHYLRARQFINYLDARLPWAVGREEWIIRQVKADAEWRKEVWELILGIDVRHSRRGLAGGRGT
jgi:hypothetical protein